MDLAGNKRSFSMLKNFSAPEFITTDYWSFQLSPFPDPPPPASENATSPARPRPATCVRQVTHDQRELDRPESDTGRNRLGSVKHSTVCCTPPGGAGMPWRGRRPGRTVPLVSGRAELREGSAQGRHSVLSAPVAHGPRWGRPPATRAVLNSTKKKRKENRSVTPTDGGWRVTDGIRRVTDGGWSRWKNARQGGP